MQLETPLDQLFETGAHVRVLRALVGLPKGFAASARDIARRAGVAHTTAARVLHGLTTQRVVHVQAAGRADLYQFNEQHVLTEQVRTLFQTEATVRTRLIDYLRTEMARRLGTLEGAFLFGSARRRTTRPSSDVDVALVAPERTQEELAPALAALASDVRERFGTELNVVVGPSRHRRGRPKLWQRIEREGLQLLPKRAGRG